MEKSKNVNGKAILIFFFFFLELILIVALKNNTYSIKLNAKKSGVQKKSRDGGVSSLVKGRGPVSRDGGNREALVFTSMHSTAAAADRLHINVLLSFL